MYLRNDYIKPRYKLEVCFTAYNQKTKLIEIYTKKVKPKDIFKVFSCEYSKSQGVWHVILIAMNNTDKTAMIFCEGRAIDFIKITDFKILETLTLLYE